MICAVPQSFVASLVFGPTSHWWLTLFQSALGHFHCLNVASRADYEALPQVCSSSAERSDFLWCSTQYANHVALCLRLPSAADSLYVWL